MSIPAADDGSTMCRACHRTVSCDERFLNSLVRHPPHVDGGTSTTLGPGAPGTPVVAVFAYRLTPQIDFVTRNVAAVFAYARPNSQSTE